MHLSEVRSLGALYRALFFLDIRMSLLGRRIATRGKQLRRHNRGWFFT